MTNTPRDPWAEQRPAGQERRPRGAQGVPRGLSPNGIVLIALVAALGAIYFVAPEPPAVLTFAFVLAAWMLSVALHEFGHALAGYLFGDTTVVDKGYLTFDPTRYTDVGVSLILPLIALALGGIGFPGGAVYIRNDLIPTRLGRSLTSLAGPAMTALVLALIGAVFFAVRQGYATLPIPFLIALAFLGFLQASALVLNLLPIPGLDGFGVISPYLPAQLRARANQLGGAAFLLLFLALFFLPGANGAFFGQVARLAAFAGIPPGAAMAGFSQFRFWQG